MTVDDIDLTELGRRLTAFAAARDWEQYHTPKNLVAALSVEASELLEIFQWLTPEQSARVMDDPGSAHRVEDEIADVLAYLLQLCTVLGVDPAAALAAKIERNESRFPVPGAGGGGRTDGAGGTDTGVGGDSRPGGGTGAGGGRAGGGVVAGGGAAGESATPGE